MHKKLTVIQMADYLGVSKEAIYNRIRRGSLECVVENSKKYILLTPSLEKEAKKPKKMDNTGSMNREYIELLKQQLEELKQKNHKLENDKEQLQKEKEKLLVESKEKIESIYKSRDEYIKNILSLTSMPSLENSLHVKEDIVEVDEFEDEVDIVEQICESFEDWVGLKEYLNEKEYPKAQKKEIKKRIKKEIGSSKHLKESGGEIFIKKDIKLKKIIGKI